MTDSVSGGGLSARIQRKIMAFKFKCILIAGAPTVYCDISNESPPSTADSRWCFIDLLPLWFSGKTTNLSSRIAAIGGWGLGVSFLSDEDLNGKRPCCSSALSVFTFFVLSARHPTPLSQRNHAIGKCALHFSREKNFRR